MSFPLFKSTLRKNGLLMLLFLGVMEMYSVVMITMFNPDSIDALNAMFQVLPPDMMKALGFSGVFTDYVGYLASWLYGLILTAFPMVYCVILINRLVTKPVDSGSIACLLATPNSRVKIMLTKGVFALCSLFVMHLLLFGLNLLFTKIVLPDVTVDVPAFLQINLTVMLVNLTVISIVFFCACLFSDSKLALGFGSGIPIAFLLFNMLGNASEDAEILKKFSVYGWYDPVSIANGADTLAVNLIYTGIIVVLLAAAVLIFKRKQLSI